MPADLKSLITVPLSGIMALQKLTIGSAISLLGWMARMTMCSSLDECVAFPHPHQRLPAKRIYMGTDRALRKVKPCRAALRSPWRITRPTCRAAKHAGETALFARACTHKRRADSVRFRGKSGHHGLSGSCLLLTQSGHQRVGLLPCKLTLKPHFAGRKRLV
jgi:hypothetical protein